MLSLLHPVEGEARLLPPLQPPVLPQPQALALFRSMDSVVVSNGLELRPVLAHILVRLPAFGIPNAFE